MSADAATVEPPTDAAAPPSAARASLVDPVLDAFVGLGDWTLFSLRATSGVFTKHMKRSEFLRACVEVGVASFGVVGVTGVFIGMVLAVQAYNQFHTIGLETSLGAVIHMSIIRELGPVLAAVMLAGRVGTAMAAQLATMRVTEQIDALACLGVDPVKFLVAPRFLACVVTIPLLTVVADALGIVGSTFIALKVFQIDGFHYWRHTANFVTLWDLFVGLFKSVVFGGVLSLICCHRGFNSRAGAEGVGRAATEGFVLSFVAVLVIDFVLGLLFNTLGNVFFPVSASRIA